MSELFEDVSVIYEVTVEDLIAEGSMVDVTDTSEAAEVFPGMRVCVTRAVFEEYVDWTREDTERQTSQDFKGRLWDLLYMGKVFAVAGALRKIASGAVELDDVIGRPLFYRFLVVPRGKTSRRKMPVTRWVKAVLGVDPSANRPLLTILKREED